VFSLKLNSALSSRLGSRRSIPSVLFVRSCLVLVVVLAGCAASASREPQTPVPSEAPLARIDSEDVSAALEPIRQQHGLPALAALAWRGGGIVKAGVVGVRKLGSPERVTLGDRFHIGSDTKAMTATLLAMLVEEGRLSWTSTLADVFPDLADRMHPAYRAVTLEQLLAHRGGTPSELEAGGLWARLWLRQGSPTEQRRTLLEGVVTHPPAVEPGKQYLYSNAGYAIAGAMAEQVTGEAWEDLMCNRLFTPLGMTTVGFGAPGTVGKIDEPWGHAIRGHKLLPVEPGVLADNPPAIGPAGTVHVSLPDWAKFAALHLRGAQGVGGLLKAETFARLQSPAEGQEYALGWLVVSRPWGGRVLTHGGSNTMWYAVVWVAPERDFAVLVATNAGGDEAAKACDDAAAMLIHALTDR
jgi:CubicO group peptidase (beta-lactamase class C family)